MCANQDRCSAMYIMPEHEKEPIAERNWICLGPGPFPVADMPAPLPSMSEVMADSTKLDPLGHRWGRGAHWPLVVAVGHRRERTPATRQQRNQQQLQKRMHKAEASALAEGASGSAGAPEERAKGKGRGGRYSGKGWSGYAWSSSNTWTGAGTSSGSWQDSSPWRTTIWR